MTQARLLMVWLLAASVVWFGQATAAGQVAAQAQPAPKTPAAREQEELQQAIAQAGQSQVDMIRALEMHLRKYPSSAQRVDIEAGIIKLALELDDQRRILQYGERALAVDSQNADLLERLTRLLLNDEKNPEQNTRALAHAKALEKWAQLQLSDKSAHNAAQRYEQTQMMMAKALVYQARASGNLGKPEEALALAQSSFETSASSEGAREIARWLERAGKHREAISSMADSFLLNAPQSGARADDRKRMSELAKKANLPEADLGAELLASHDRLELAIEDRRAKLLEIDPNLEAVAPLDYVVSGLDGKKLALKTLKGKVIVMDFWATWCVPCRTQQPLYDQVKEKFKNNPSVVFLNIASDEDHSVVKPFLDQTKWDKTVYFDDGLAVFLRVGSIPTTVIFGTRGDISGRLVGFIPELFVDMLTQRIQEALAEPR